MGTSNLTDGDISNLMKGAQEKKSENPVVKDNGPKTNKTNGGMTMDIKPSNDRDLLIIGTGDAGAIIASGIKTGLPEARTFIYNTSMQKADVWNMDDFIHPGGQDGSGKSRAYSKGVFKDGAFKSLEALLKELPKHNWRYNIVTTSTDGGTGGGASPNVAKFTESATKDTTVVIGVYPKLSEDERSQWNALNWQADIEKTELPYMIFDNEHYGDLSDQACYEKVDAEIVRAVKVFSGKLYGESSSLDNKDFSRLVARNGRINIYSSDRKPRVNEDLGKYLEVLINESCQPLPVAAEAYGLLIKAPAEFIAGINTDISPLMSRFGCTSKDVHMEESTDFCISLIITGAGAPNERLKNMKMRYDDLMAMKVSKESTVNSLLNGLGDPAGEGSKKGKILDNPMDALDI